LLQAPPADRFQPVSYLRDAAICYRTLTPDQADYSRVKLDPALGRRISDAYLAGPSFDDRARPAYEAFRAETIRQFRYLVNRLGLRIRMVSYDPYDSALPMAEDLRQRWLRVFSTIASGNPHRLLTNADNDKFRAVHDAFGHASIGRGFTRDGEEAAWRKHRLMYSPLARKALATETRGQSCVQQFHLLGDGFAEQKVMLLPKVFR
jgi:hypothetical protein